MNASRRNKKITIQKPDPASPRDGAGQRVTEFLDVAAKIWASVEPLSGREEFIAAQRQASTTHVVTVDYDPRIAGIDLGHRILYGDRVLVLDAPPKNVGERNIDLEFRCTEGLRTEN